MRRGRRTQTLDLEAGPGRASGGASGPGTPPRPGAAPCGPGAGRLRCRRLRGRPRPGQVRPPWNHPGSGPWRAGGLGTGPRSGRVPHRVRRDLSGTGSAPVSPAPGRGRGRERVASGGRRRDPHPAAGRTRRRQWSCGSPSCRPTPTIPRVPGGGVGCDMKLTSEETAGQRRYQCQDVTGAGRGRTVSVPSGPPRTCGYQEGQQVTVEPGRGVHPDGPAPVTVTDPEDVGGWGTPRGVCPSGERRSDPDHGRTRGSRAVGSDRGGHVLAPPLGLPVGEATDP